MGKPRKTGRSPARDQGVRNCEPALEPRRRREGSRKKAKVSNRTWEIRPSGIIGGPPEPLAMVEMRSHLATERARLVTLPLPQARRSSIPTANREAASTDAPTRGGLLRSSGEAGSCLWSEGSGSPASRSIGQPETGRADWSWRKAAAYRRWHEPDESRGSRPESVSASGCKSPGRLGWTNRTPLG